ncbi:hypothetical protein V6N11_056492 [Hibiscus sabdariffa]|uniref:Uncharacterized protein n=1 Tax=Hibiscus sabdariffa TaxID=183260 RepID=A0ABR2T3Z2_9ROSI
MWLWLEEEGYPNIVAKLIGSSARSNSRRSGFVFELSRVQESYHSTYWHFAYYCKHHGERYFFAYDPSKPIQYDQCDKEFHEHRLFSDFHRYLATCDREHITSKSQSVSCHLWFLPLIVWSCHHRE